MNVLMISPGFPGDMAYFTRGLAQVGARVLGVGDQNLRAMPPEARDSLTDYLQVKDLWDEDGVAKQVQRWLRGRSLDRIECLWEPGMVLAARLREIFHVPGLNVEQTLPFRDKERMKQVLDAAGIRTPHHFRATTKNECIEAAEKIGYPVIVKPIDGAGSADTYAVHSKDEFSQALELLDHVPEVSVEEYIEGEEFTFDTVCANGNALFHNIAWYRPKPLVMRLNPSIPPRTLCVRDTTMPEVAAGREMGFRVLDALGMESGFTHMEWFRTDDGEAVFGEIGCRAPGGRLTHGMNYAANADMFSGWAEAVCYGRLSQHIERPYNSCLIFLRAHGDGTIQRVEGLEHMMSHHGESIVHIDLVPVGSPKQDWRKVVTGDGWIVVRHPDLKTTIEMSDEIATHVRMFAA